MTRATGSQGPGAFRSKSAAWPSARMLIHQPDHAGSQGQVSDLEIRAVEVERLGQLMETVLAKHTGQPLDVIAKDLERDKIFAAPAAKEYGLIDHVVSPRSLAGAS
ncbi:ATP-dependent Clp protease proteolytic subunit [Kitasatospora sp. NBC_01560]